jgi:hypothetical protein
MRVEQPLETRWKGGVTQVVADALKLGGKFDTGRRGKTPLMGACRTNNVEVRTPTRVVLSTHLRIEGAERLQTEEDLDRGVPFLPSILVRESRRGGSHRGSARLNPHPPRDTNSKW